MEEDQRRASKDFFSTRGIDGRGYLAQKMVENFVGPGNDIQREDFFYAGASLDWNPLHRFTVREESSTTESPFAPLFIFADAGIVGSKLDKSMSPTAFARRGLSCEIIPKHILHSRGILKILGLDALCDAGLNRENLAVRMAKVTRTVAKQPRVSWLLYLGLDPVDGYRALFTNRNAAPKYLCLPIRAANKVRRPPDLSWDGPFGKIVQESRSREPTFVISNAPGYDWPWSQRWLAFNNWHDAAMYRIPGPDPEPVHADARRARTIAVSKSKLTPDTIGRDAQGVLISIALHRQFQWPPHLQLLVDADDDYEPDARTKRMNPCFTRLRLSGLPMRKAFDLLGKKCSHLCCVETIRFGFEDEGLELRLLREEWDPPQKLVIHCEAQGEVELLGPYAHEIV